VFKFGFGKIDRGRVEMRMERREGEMEWREVLLTLLSLLKSRTERMGSGS
jgi:hypothetical protein